MQLCEHPRRTGAYSDATAVGDAPWHERKECDEAAAVDKPGRAVRRSQRRRNLRNARTHVAEQCMLVRDAFYNGGRMADADGEDAFSGLETQDQVAVATLQVASGSDRGEIVPLRQYRRQLW